MIIFFLYNAIKSIYSLRAITAELVESEIPQKQKPTFMFNF